MLHAQQQLVERRPREAERGRKLASAIRVDDADGATAFLHVVLELDLVRKRLNVRHELLHGNDTTRLP